MKILYFERETTGHRIPHLVAIVNNNQAESVLVVPERIDECNCKQYIYNNREEKKRTISAFLKMIREVYTYVEKEKPDIVHFTDGNIFYRFFGLGLGLFNKYKTVLTNHNAEDGFLHGISGWCISKKVDVVVVTCEYSKELFERFNANNVINIEYPHFNNLVFDKETARNFYHLDNDIPVIACVGGTRKDKGLDIMLEALKHVEKPFQLLVAGQEEHFKESFIDEMSQKFSNRLVKHLKFLTDEEFAMALCAADYVAVPYRKGFNGASGPLGEGVWRNKCIIGPKSKNLGDIIDSHHLGFTFVQEDPLSLAALLNSVLGTDFRCDEEYNKYRELMDYNVFTQSYRDIYNSLMK